MVQIYCVDKTKRIFLAAWPRHFIAILTLEECQWDNDDKEQGIGLYCE